MAIFPPAGGFAEPINPVIGLLQRLRGQAGGGAIHAFGPGGAVTGNSGAHHGVSYPGISPADAQSQSVLQALVEHLAGGLPPKGGFMEGPPTLPDASSIVTSHYSIPHASGGVGQDTYGHTDRPADLMHGEGNDAAAAQLWAQHHPGAVARGNVPPWVARILARRINAARNGGHVTPPPAPFSAS